MNNQELSASRRSFLRFLGLASLTAAILTVVVAAIRMLFPNVFQTPPAESEFDAGLISAVQDGKVDLRFLDNKVFLVRDDDRVFALVAECPQDGCVPDWREANNIFVCPCCGTNYSQDGQLLQGSSPGSLERAAIRQSDIGEIFIDTSRRFRQAAGDWDKPEAFLQL